MTLAASPTEVTDPYRTHTAAVAYTVAEARLAHSGIVTEGWAVGPRGMGSTGRHLSGVRRARVPPMREIAPGLWRWTAPHPAWRPGAERDSPDDWDEYVGSPLYVAGDAAVFIDPLLPRDEEQFWSWADERVAGRRVVVLTTLLPHRRNREQVAAATGRRRPRQAPPA
jgi:hypothetical protein